MSEISTKLEAANAKPRRHKCEVKDGKFVVRCSSLDEMVDGYAAFSKAKGVRVWEYYKLGAGKSRSFVGVKCKAYPDGFLFNFCPACGTDISAPFAGDDAEPQTAALEAAP